MKSWSLAGDSSRMHETGPVRVNWTICQRAFWGSGLLVVLAGVASAGIIESFTLTDVESFAIVGDPLNDRRSTRISAPGLHTLGTISWSGRAAPRPDPADANVHPSWGRDLGVRITHPASGIEASVLLGSGEGFGPGPTTFSGSTRALNGLPIAEGDEVLFEFFEDFDDPVVSPDATWATIELTLLDDVALPPGPPGDGIVRLQTLGGNTFPTTPGNEGAEFFRIEYGAGEGSPISAAILNTHARDGTGVWFDSDEIGESPDLDGTFHANFLDGLSTPTFTFETEDSDPAFAGDFAVLRLSFVPGEFGPGDSIHFGIDTDGGFVGQPTGDAFASLDPPLTFTVLFEDGTLATGPLTQRRQDLDQGAILDLDVRQRVLQADLDGDGDVDGDDLIEILLHFGQTHLATHAQGDTDGNGRVDFADAMTWRAQFARSPPVQAPASRAVPEPPGIVTVLAMMISTALAWSFNCRRQRAP